MAEVIGNLIGFAIVILLGWVAPIALGVRTATNKGYSPNWMWFGIYPFTGWIALLILACLPHRTRCSCCGGFVEKHFRICPYCLNHPQSDSEVPTSKLLPPQKLADVTPDFASPARKRNPVAVLAAIALVLVSCITIVTSLGTTVSSTFQTRNAQTGPAPARPAPKSTDDQTKPYAIGIGTKIVIKTAAPLMVGNQVVDDSSLHHIFVVDAIDGPWLWIISGGVSGWVPADQVVPFDQAIEYYTGLIRDNPSDARWYGARANIRLDRGEYDIAINDLNEAIRLDPKYAGAYNNRGLVWQAKGDYDKALADNFEAIRFDPKCAVAYYNRGTIWQAKGDNVQALVDFSEAIRLDPKYANAYINRGAVWQDKGDNDKALADFNEAIRLDPKQAKSFINRGLVWQAKGDNDQALADYTEAIRLDPKNVLAFNNRGNVWLSKQGYDQAIVDSTEAVRLDPRYPNAYYNRGIAWHAKQGYDKAIVDLTEAIRLDPNFGPAYSSRALILATCPDVRFFNVKQSFEDAVRACELTAWQDADSIDTLASSYAAAGDFAHATEYQEKAIRLLPEHHPNRKDYSDRLAGYRKALEQAKPQGAKPRSGVHST
jgi:tetratricopeptide (TPR) repeat protein